MMRNQFLERYRTDIKSIARKHGVGNIKLFGSMARDDSSDASDVDFLIEVTGPTTPWFPGGLVAELEELLGKKVDVVELTAINPIIKEEIIKEAVAL